MHIVALQESEVTTRKTRFVIYMHKGIHYASQQLSSSTIQHELHMSSKTVVQSN